MSLDTDKRNEKFEIRIPDCLKFELEKLSKHDKSRLNDALLVTMAKEIHNARFDPESYLKTDD